MNPDSPLDKLGRFTPHPAIDPAEILFRAGRASARTPRGWKLAVAALALTNAATAALWLGREHPPAPVPPPVVVPVVVPVPVPEADPPPSADPATPWSVGVMTRDLDHNSSQPPAEAGAFVPPGRPLTPLAARRGEID